MQRRKGESPVISELCNKPSHAGRRKATSSISERKNKTKKQIKELTTMSVSASKYKTTLTKFLSYTDGVNYPSNTEFTQERLQQITPEQIVAWFNHKVYGTPTPTVDDNPTLGRSNSLHYWKKALSYFIPNKHTQWNEISKVGNPTKSLDVNEMIKRVRQKEVRKQGKKSFARRPLRETEFREILTRLRQSDDIIVKYGIPALLVFQFHLIGRIDDCSAWKREFFKPHDVHADKCAKVRLAWGKNVHEERDAPWQHVVGAIDKDYCVLLNVGLWLEVFLKSVMGAGQRPHVFGFTNELDPEKAAKKTKAFVYRVLKPIFDDVGVELENNGSPIGSHSIRKYASTWVRSNGISKDDKDHRGRWQHRRTSDRYDDVQLDFVDAKVAAVLAKGGVCRYHVVDPACTDDWIVSVVTPNISGVYGQQLAKLLGRSLLWLAFSEHKEMLPPPMLQQITSAYSQVRTIADGQNPVAKKLQIVTGHDAQVFIDDVDVAPGIPGNVVNTGGNNANNNNNNTGQTAYQHQQQILLALLSQSHRQQQAIADLSATVDSLKGQVRTQTRALNSVIQHVDHNPVNMLHRHSNNSIGRRNLAQATNEQGTSATSNATLSPNPRTLHILWDEYIRGIGGRKPAKDFTRFERGQCKFKYSRRKIFWDLVSSHVRANRLASEVIEMIYDAYGHSSSVTIIINRIRRDKRDNILPQQLRI